MSEWISCEDRLPDDNREVLAYGGKWVGINSIGQFNNKTKQWEAGWDCCEQLYDVTHWQELPPPPLPPLPKGQGDE